MITHPPLLRAGPRLPVWVLPGSFHLPPPSVPLVLVGPGTGCAPFRSLIHQRAALASESNCSSALILSLEVRRKTGSAPFRSVTAVHERDTGCCRSHWHFRTAPTFLASMQCVALCTTCDSCAVDCAVCVSLCIRFGMWPCNGRNVPFEGPSAPLRLLGCPLGHGPCPTWLTPSAMRSAGWRLPGDV